MEEYDGKPVELLDEVVKWGFGFEKCLRSDSISIKGEIRKQKYEPNRNHSTFLVGLRGGKA